ncbi:MAG: YchJ family metal-binding protein [Gammaproteobacteria bacterium]|nr:YchJ family metal-binding protein [Gammaproteobacteria bacterium]
MNKTEKCPCGSEISFQQCCAKYLNDDAKPETAEQLMRSRYCAYVKHDEAYLLNSWHDQTQPETIDFNPTTQWIRLRIVNSDRGMINDNEGNVEFTAIYKQNGRAYRLHEVSRFIRDSSGNWSYIDGEVT